MEYLHDNYGKLPWSDVMQPAIKVARNGFPVNADTVRFMNYATEDYDFLADDPTWAVDFAPNGTRVGLGDIITRKRYANTLEEIAEHGADVFYTGLMANATIKAVQGSNGTLVLEDLEAYRAISRKPTVIDYRGYRIIGCGAPASGAVTLSVMKTVEGYEDFGAMEALNLSTHRLDEAIRFAYGEASIPTYEVIEKLTKDQRTSLGDPDFVDGIQALEQDMTNGTLSAITRSKISDFHTLNVSAYDPAGLENAPS